MSGCNYQGQPTRQRANGLFQHCLATVNHRIVGPNTEIEKGYCPQTCTVIHCLKKMAAGGITITLIYLFTDKTEEVLVI